MFFTVIVSYLKHLGFNALHDRTLQMFWKGHERPQSENARHPLM